MTTAGIIGLNLGRPKLGAAAALSTEEAAFLDNDLDLEGPAIPTGPPATASSYFEAIDADGNVYWQEMPAAKKPKKLFHRPVFPITGLVDTPREGGLASPIGCDGTPNLTNAQVKAPRNEQKLLQKALTDEAVAVANRRVSEAMLASGSAPKFLYRSDYRAIHVKEGDLGAASTGPIA